MQIKINSVPNLVLNKLSIFRLHKCYNTLSLPKQKLNTSRHFPPLDREWKDNIYGYNNNLLINSTTKNLIADKIINSYINITSNKEKLRKLKRSRSKLKVFSRPQLFLSTANVKETNDKAVITVYIFFRKNRGQLKNFLEFYKKPLSDFIYQNKREINFINRIKKRNFISRKRKKKLFLKFNFLKKVLKKSKNVLQQKLLKMNKIHNNKSRLIEKFAKQIHFSPAKNVFKTITQRKKKRLKIYLKNNYFWQDIQYKQALEYITPLLKKSLNSKVGKQLFYFFAQLVLHHHGLKSYIEVKKKNVKLKNEKLKNVKSKIILEGVKVNICKIIKGPIANENITTYELQDRGFSQLNQKVLKQEKSFIMLEPIDQYYIPYLGSIISLREKISKKLFDYVRKFLYFPYKKTRFINSFYEKYKTKLQTQLRNAIFNFYGSWFNKHKLKNNFLSLLKTSLNNIYQKKVELNIINIKYLNLNSDILIKSIIVRLRNKKSNTRKVLSKALKSGGIAKMSYRNLFINKNNKFKYKLDSYKNYNYTEIISLKKSNHSLELLDSLAQQTNMLNKSTNNVTVDYRNNSLQNLKYKWVTGIRLEARGRLSNRSGASRARFYLKYKGSLKNMDYLNNYNKKLTSNLLLRKVNLTNLQYTYKSSERRVGTFGVKGWISSN